MSDSIQVTGMVLSATPVGEYDKRLVLLTRERGKITAFARGARRTNSVLLAAANPFSFGVYTVYEGRNAYTLVKADISNYFVEVKADFEATCYACYFMELADYYTRENLDAAAMLNLLYVTLRVLPNPQPDNELIRCIFEMKAMILNGEYPQDIIYDSSLDDTLRYTLNYVIQSPIQKLYTFTLKKEVMSEFRKIQDRLNSHMIDRTFKSLPVIQSLLFTEKA